MIIDAKDQVVGRFASFVAKKALLGEKIDVINSEKAILTGSHDYILAKYTRKNQMGSMRTGPFHSRLPDRFVRRIIKGMLPMDKARGRDAYDKVMCYIGTPDQFKGKETTKAPGADSARLLTLKKTTVGEICKHMGGKWYE